MKKTLLLMIAGFLVAFCAFSADEPKGAMRFTNTGVELVLSIYKSLSGLELVVDSRVKHISARITLESSDPLTKGDSMKLIERVLVEQAGVVITRLDDKRAAVTYNDALPITPAKKALKQ